MSNSEFPPGSPSSTANTLHAPSPEAVAAAVERRFAQAPQQRSAAQELQLHEKRQMFRRKIDPGIVRPNAKEKAQSSLKTLLTIAENLLREPDNPKFQRFKPTNTVIKRELVDRKGALEYAIEMGFRPQVENFQPYYAFHKRHIDDLQVGAEILRVFITRYTEHDEREALNKKSEKAVAAAAHEKVKLAFMDDRKTKMQRDEMERQAREARAALQASQPEASASSTHSRSPSLAVESMGEGHTLREFTGGERERPPPYGP